MNAFILEIKNEQGEKIREEIATPYKIKMGIIRKLMKLLDVVALEENETQTNDLLTGIVDMWNELINVLSNVFPGVTQDEWDNMDLEDIINVIKNIIKFATSNIIKIPVDKKK